MLIGFGLLISHWIKPVQQKQGASEDTVKQWLDSAELTSVTKHNDPAADFSYDVVMKNGTRLTVACDKNHKFIEVTALILSSPKDKRDLEQFSTVESDDLVNELMLALANSDVSVKTQLPDYVHVWKSPPIDEHLDRRLLLQTVGEVGRAIVVVRSTISLAMNKKLNTPSHLKSGQA